MAGLRSFQPIGVNCKEAADESVVECGRHVGRSAATDALAQLVNLTGRYVCVAGCTPGLQGQFAFIT
jgi:hypothetical protein